MGKKILFIHHGIGIGGAAINLRDVVSHLIEKGYEAHIFFLRNSEAVSLFKELSCTISVSNFPIYYFYHMSKWVRWYEIHKWMAQSLSFIFHSFYLAPKVYKSFSPDFVYLNSSVLIDWAFSAHRAKIKSILNIQETISDGHLGIRKKIISVCLSRFVDRLIFISEYNKSRFNLKGISYNPLVVYNVVHGGDTSDIDSKLSLKLYDFIYLGGESSIKGWEFIDALLLTDIEFSIVIGGEFFDSKVISRLTSDRRVIFVGVLKNPLVSVASARFLLSPFRTPHFSRPIIEAYFCKTIPIASRLPGIEEQLIDRETGYLFELGIGNFLNLIRDILLLNESELQAIVMQGQVYKEKFNVDINLTKLDELFTSLGKY